MNLNQLTYKKKNQYLIWGAPLFFVLVYFLALNKTMVLWQENAEMHRQLTQAEQAPVLIKNSEQKLNQFNAKLGSFLVEENDNQEKIVQAANEFCQKNNLILREVPELVVQQENDFEVINVQIVAQGAFVNLLKLVYYFEVQNKIGRLTSVRFEKKEDFQTRKQYLAVRILLQNIKIIKK